MEILLLLIPLSALVVVGAVVVFFRAVDGGQFEDSSGRAAATLFEEAADRNTRDPGAGRDSQISLRGNDNGSALDRHPVPPDQGMDRHRTRCNSVLRPLLTHTVPWALVPALCWYYGVTRVGWQFGHGAARRRCRGQRACRSAVCSISR